MAVYKRPSYLATTQQIIDFERCLLLPYIGLLSYNSISPFNRLEFLSERRYARYRKVPGRNFGELGRYRNLVSR